MKRTNQEVAVVPTGAADSPSVPPTATDRAAESGVSKVRRALTAGLIAELTVTIAVPNRQLGKLLCFVQGDDFDGISTASGGDYCVLGALENIDEKDWVEFSQDPDFGGDGSRVIQSLPGQEYTLGVEWRNGDFFEPFTALELEEALKDYEHPH